MIRIRMSEVEMQAPADNQLEEAQVNEKKSTFGFQYKCGLNFISDPTWT